MNWMQQLYNVYEHNEHLIGVFEERRNQRMTLLPVAHMLQNAQIQINLTPEGNFHNAKVIENERTIVPMSLNSANRTSSAIRPHYLHDKLFRSEEHTSELQSRFDLVCRLLLEI